MNKQQFIKAFADKAQFTQKDAGIAFEAMAETIAEVLKTGEKIQIAGFGTFSLKTKAAKEVHLQMKRFLLKQRKFLFLNSVIVLEILLQKSRIV